MPPAVTSATFQPRWTRAVSPGARIDYTLNGYAWAEAHWPWMQAVCTWAFRYPAPQRAYGDYFTLVLMYNLLQAAGPNLNPAAIGAGAKTIPPGGAHEPGQLGGVRGDAGGLGVHLDLAHRDVAAGPGGHDQPHPGGRTGRRSTSSTRPRRE